MSLARQKRLEEKKNKTRLPIHAVKHSLQTFSKAGLSNQNNSPRLREGLENNELE